MEACVSFFRNLSKKHHNGYRTLMPEIVSILPEVKILAEEDQEPLRCALVTLIDLASVAPRMFKAQFHDLILFCVGVIQNQELEDSCRQNAMELLATFSDEAPSMCRQDPDYTKQMVIQCLGMMTEVGADDDDAKEWLACDDVSSCLGLF